MRGTDCGSDHHPILAKNKRLEKNERKSELADPIYRQQFELELRNCFNAPVEPEDAEKLPRNLLISLQAVLALSVP